MKKLIKLMGLMLIAIMLVGCTKPDDEPKNEEADVNVLIQAVYSENPNWTESWTVGLPSGENTKWKATEIWFYSNKKLAYTSNFDRNKNALAIKLQEKIPGCVLYINKVNKKTYNGWIPYESDYALCIGLQSKNCNIQNVWCETIETSLLKEVYDIMINSGRDFITNYKN